MAWKSHSNRPLRRISRPEGPVTQDAIEGCLAQVDRACREIAFCELAGMIADARIRALRGALAQCREEERNGMAGGNLACRTLEAELTAREETLPLERAYRADQRDLAIARLTDAQKRLDGEMVQGAVSEALRSRVRAVLRMSADDVVAKARDRAATRVGLVW